MIYTGIRSEKLKMSNKIIYSTWSFSEKKCKAIRAKKQLSFSCTEEYYFRSICTYKCSQGYEIPDTVRRTKVCLATGIWNGKDPYCEGN